MVDWNEVVVEDWIIQISKGAVYNFKSRLRLSIGFMLSYSVFPFPEKDT